jgi:tripartite-type tricarboxylate transporter receptor subunit TctC
MEKMQPRLMAKVKSARNWVLPLCCAAIWGILENRDARAQARPYYEDKTIRILDYGTAGGGSDLLARLVARHLPKQIPGSPQVVVQNMPGAAGAIAANYVYTVAKPDGLTLGLIAGGLYQAQLLGKPEIKYDWVKFGWIGTDQPNDTSVFVRSDSGHRSLDDIKAAREPVVCADSAAGSPNYAFVRLLTEVFGARFKQVLGYQGSGAMNLAIERGEAVCRAISITTLLSAEPLKTWVKSGFIRVLVHSGREKDAALPDVPTVWELAQKQQIGKDHLELMKVVLAAPDFGRPFVAPPGISADRLELLRNSFSKTMKDPEFLIEARKLSLDVNPKSGTELERLARDVMETSPQMVKRMDKLLQ